ncbi:MAG: hydroxyacid dehydrogenase [Anaerolineales bacterium]
MYNSRVLTMAWRVLVTDGLSEEGLRLLRDQAEVIESETLEALGESDALIVRGRTKVTAEVLDQARPGLKVIGRAGVGVDNIDLQAAKSKGLTVVNAPQAATVAVAELTLGLLLSLSRHIPAADASMRRTEWRKSELKGSELSEKTLGIIGVGRIGAAVAERARAFGMNVLGYDALIADEELINRGTEPTEFDSLLGASDYVCLHLPLNEETRGTIGREALSKMKPGARLVSVARGGIVDEQALLAALESGHLSGAALDVFSEEPPGESPLLQHPNMIATPHLGAQTREAQVKAGRDIASEVLAALNGEPLRWRVV